jgi:hypothetical protein
MRGLVLVSMISAVMIQPSFAQHRGPPPSSCSHAADICIKRKELSCDAECQAYCNKRKTLCLQTGNFVSKANTWNGLLRY